MTDPTFENLPTVDQEVRVQLLIRDGSALTFSDIHLRVDGARYQSHRAVDRTLQRLRRAGKIGYLNRRWRLVRMT